MLCAVYYFNTLEKVVIFHHRNLVVNKTFNLPILFICLKDRVRKYWVKDKRIRNDQVKYDRGLNDQVRNYRFKYDWGTNDRVINDHVRNYQVGNYRVISDKARFDWVRSNRGLEIIGFRLIVFYNYKLFCMNAYYLRI